MKNCFASNIQNLVRFASDLCGLCVKIELRFFHAKNAEGIARKERSGGLKVKLKNCFASNIQNLARFAFDLCRLCVKIELRFLNAKNAEGIARKERRGGLKLKNEKLLRF